MSKSLGNFLLAHDLLENRKYKGPVIRLALLSAQYRQPLDWGEKAYHQAEALYNRITTVWEKLKHVEAAVGEAPESAVLEALCDDLNTPLAFAKLSELIKTINKSEDPRKAECAYRRTRASQSRQEPESRA